MERRRCCGGKVTARRSFAGSGAAGEGSGLKAGKLRPGRPASASPRGSAGGGDRQALSGRLEGEQRPFIGLQRRSVAPRRRVGRSRRWRARGWRRSRHSGRRLGGQSSGATQPVKAQSSLPMPAPGSNSKINRPCAVTERELRGRTATFALDPSSRTAAFGFRVLDNIRIIRRGPNSHPV